MKLLLYCVKAKKQKDLLWSNNLKKFFLDGAYNRIIDDLPKYLLNGKIVAECDFEVEEIIHADNCISYYCKKTTLLREKSCLTNGQIYSYLKGKNGYAIHIKNLHIFDKPRELKQLETCDYKTIKKAPQNMMKCMVLRNDEHYDEYVLISIQPQWLCKILNKEKTIEIRKKVLKEMIK
jgi:predicted transcriptional regulator